MCFQVAFRVCTLDERVQTLNSCTYTYREVQKGDIEKFHGDQRLLSRIACRSLIFLYMVTSIMASRASYRFSSPNYRNPVSISMNLSESPPTISTSALHKRSCLIFWCFLSWSRVHRHRKTGSREFFRFCWHFLGFWQLKVCFYGGAKIIQTGEWFQCWHVYLMMHPSGAWMSMRFCEFENCRRI